MSVSLYYGEVRLGVTEVVQNFWPQIDRLTENLQVGPKILVNGDIHSLPKFWTLLAKPALLFQNWTKKNATFLIISGHLTFLKKKRRKCQITTHYQKMVRFFVLNFGKISRDLQFWVQNKKAATEKQNQTYVYFFSTLPYTNYLKLDVVKKLIPETYKSNFSRCASKYNYCLLSKSYISKKKENLALTIQNKKQK